MMRRAWLVGVVMLAACGGGDSTGPKSGQPAVVSVAFLASTRAKVGEALPIAVTQKLADSTTVTRLVTFSASSGTITPAGFLTPSTAGVITVTAMIDGKAWPFTIVAYDWTPVVGSTLIATSLESDAVVTSRFGVAELPTLSVICGTAGSIAGAYVVSVGFTNIITNNGIVAYSLVGAAQATTATWLEGSSFHTLTFPGSNSAAKQLATTFAASTFVAFAFGEYNAGTRTLGFHTTGMPTALAPVNAACPGASVATGAQAATLIAQFNAAMKSPFRNQ